MVFGKTKIHRQTLGMPCVMLISASCRYDIILGSSCADMLVAGLTNRWDPHVSPILTEKEREKGCAITRLKGRLASLADSGSSLAKQAGSMVLGRTMAHLGSPPSLPLTDWSHRQVFSPHTNSLVPHVIHRAVNQTRAYVWHLCV